MARRRIRHTGLAEASFRSPEEVVAWHGAMQAQEYGLAKWSIGQRCAGIVDQDVDRALAAGAIVRTHVLRPTWHFVAAGDARWMLALSGPRVQQRVATRYRELGLDNRTRARCESAIAAALGGGNRLTRESIGEVLTAAGVDVTGQRLPFILLHCELEALICSGGLAGKQQTYALLDDRVPKKAPFNRDDALVELVRRYLQSHGPATLQDLRWWSGLTIADIKKALDLMVGAARNEVIDGITFWSAAETPRSVGGDRRAHLLQAYDELIVGYTESRYFGDPHGAAARVAWRDRSLPTGVVLVNAGVTGNWRRVVKKDSVDVEVLLYSKPTPAVDRLLQAAAAQLGRFVGRRASVESRSSAG